jgi:lysine 2,3-aminomutase
MLALIDPSDPDDPVAMQFLPSSAELVSHPDELPDPIGDHVHSPVTGLVHRYPDRVLLKALHVCPVYCRFCFRRDMIGPQGDGTMAADQLAAAHAYIAAHPEIWEIIITGGDPLVLSPRRIMDLIAPLREIAHVRTVRFHTRVPAVDPDRIDEALAQALASSGKATVVALHANHARELGREAEAACRRLQAHGIALVSQTVLLKGINDTVETLAELMRRFVEIGVKPYYLHHPDLSPGTSHFRLSIGNGQALMTALGGQVSGLCLPRYVLDLPGGFGKVDLMSAQVENTGPGSYRITDRHGQQHVYRDCLSSIPA